MDSLNRGDVWGPCSVTFGSLEKVCEVELVQQQHNCSLSQLFIEVQGLLPHPLN